MCVQNDSICRVDTWLYRDIPLMPPRVVLSPVPNLFGVSTYRDVAFLIWFFDLKDGRIRGVLPFSMRENCLIRLVVRSLGAALD